MSLLSLATIARAGDEIVDAPKPLQEQQLAEPRQRGSGDMRIAATLDDGDAVAALDGIRLALTEVGDGSSYVWHRRDGVLSGMAQPSASYKDTLGQPCRHILVMLNTWGRSSRIDGVACRTASGRWQLDG